MFFLLKINCALLPTKLNNSIIKKHLKMKEKLISTPCQTNSKYNFQRYVAMLMANVVFRFSKYFYKLYVLSRALIQGISSTASSHQ